MELAQALVERFGDLVEVRRSAENVLAQSEPPACSPCSLETILAELRPV
ncbi:MAG: hypothetical protein HC822_15205 [Oscillochloris sp.]|nr:hypothetical protein [Oscillochloris sp.]